MPKSCPKKTWNMGESSARIISFCFFDGMISWYLIARWWFGIVVSIYLIYWEKSSQLTNIFQRGWNHQPAWIWFVNPILVYRKISPVAAGWEQRNERRDGRNLWPEAEAGGTSIGRGGWEDGILLSWLILLYKIYLIDSNIFKQIITDQCFNLLQWFEHFKAKMFREALPRLIKMIKAKHETVATRCNTSRWCAFNWNVATWQRLSSPKLQLDVVLRDENIAKLGPFWPFWPFWPF